MPERELNKRGVNMLLSHVTVLMDAQAHAVDTKSLLEEGFAKSRGNQIVDRAGSYSCCVHILRAQFVFFFFGHYVEVARTSVEPSNNLNRSPCGAPGNVCANASSVMYLTIVTFAVKVFVSTQRSRW